MNRYIYIRPLLYTPGHSQPGKSSRAKNSVQNAHAKKGRQLTKLSFGASVFLVRLCVVHRLGVLGAEASQSVYCNSVGPGGAVLCFV